VSRLARFYALPRPKANKKWEMTNMSLNFNTIVQACGGVKTNVPYNWAFWPW